MKQLALITVPDRDARFLREAYRMAATSRDDRTQNGVVIVRGGKVILGACNQFPRSVRQSEDRWLMPEKSWYVEHAERNAIYYAANQGIRLLATTMYACWAPCADCARAIIQAGIGHLVVHHDPLADERMGVPVSEQWRHSIAAGLGMLEEASIPVTVACNDLFGGELTVRFQGREVKP